MKDSRREKMRDIITEIFRLPYGAVPYDILCDEGQKVVDGYITALEALMGEVCNYPKPLVVSPDICANCWNPMSEHKPQAVSVDELALIYLHRGGDDDGYGGKTEPITYKEAYEEDLRYDKWAREEMQKACEKIKSHPKWEWGENAYPSPYERAIVAGCGQAVEELQKRVKELEALMPEERALCHDFVSQKCTTNCEACDSEDRIKPQEGYFTREDVDKIEALEKEKFGRRPQEVSVEQIEDFLKHEWKELQCIDECYMERLARAIHKKVYGGEK